MPANNTHGGDHDFREQILGELVKQLVTETSTLVKQEIDLAKAEMTEKGKQAGKGAGMFGAGGIIGFLALSALTAGLIAVVATAVDHVWLAAVIVGVVYGVVAGVLALTGKKNVQEATPPAPERTVETL
jgi:MFS family permease